MDNVWYLPPGADAGDLEEGDLVLSPAEEAGTLLVGRIRSAPGERPEWLGDAAVDIFPDDIRTLLGSERPVAIADEPTVRAVQGIATAERQRGG